jgi:hypothetical protein
MSKHTWNVGDYVRPKKTIYNTKYRIVEIRDGYLIAEIVASPTHTRTHLDPDTVVAS